MSFLMGVPENASLEVLFRIFFFEQHFVQNLTCFFQCEHFPVGTTNSFSALTRWRKIVPEGITLQVAKQLEALDP